MSPFLNKHRACRALASCNCTHAGAVNEAEEKPLTGEEEDDTVFSCRASLYHFDRSAAKPGWKERGVGVLRLNVLPGGSSRLVMRQSGILRLLLNACLYPEIKLKCQEGLPQVSFSCINAATQADAAAAANGAEAGTGAGAEAGAEACTAPVGQLMSLYAIKFGSLEKSRQFAELVEKHKQPQRQSEVVTEAACAAVDAIANSIVF